jgi:hypothetical protein
MAQVVEHLPGTFFILSFAFLFYKLENRKAEQVLGGL